MAHGGGHHTALLLGNRLRELRTKQDMTQADLAESTGLSDNFIALMERGKTSPSLQTLENLANALNVQIADLFAFNSKTPTKINKSERAIQHLLRKHTPSQIKTLLQIQKLIEKLK